jgi:hypothetical protein
MARSISLFVRRIRHVDRDRKAARHRAVAGQWPHGSDDGVVRVLDKRSLSTASSADARRSSISRVDGSLGSLRARRVRGRVGDTCGARSCDCGRSRCRCHGDARLRQLPRDRVRGVLGLQTCARLSVRSREFTLRSFDRFLAEYRSSHGRVSLEKVVYDWLGREAGRKPVTVATKCGVIRQFRLFRRRRHSTAFVPARNWTPQATVSKFLP